jgi:uncharacterized cupredoxin-like copper-binding protein
VHVFRSVRPRVAAAVGLLVIIVVIAACGGSGGPTAPPATALPSGVYAVEAKEYAFTPTTITVPAGPVTFAVRNAGVEAHEFEVFRDPELTTSIDKVESLGAGRSENLPLTLEPGTYAFACLLNGHNLLGMKGTLTVQ